MHFYPIEHTTNQHLLTQWFKRQQCLACRTLFIAPRGNGLKCSVEDRHKYEPTFKKVTKKSLQQILTLCILVCWRWSSVCFLSLKQNEGHLSLVPYCTNQRNKHLYSFLSSPTDCLWTHSSQHPDKAPLPQNPNNHYEIKRHHYRKTQIIIMTLKPTLLPRIYDNMYNQLHSVSTTGAIWKNKSRQWNLDWNINKIKNDP
jgi:hypothetical protein